MPVFSGPLTGPKVFAMFASFFAVVIGVNVTLAVQAIRTFPGLETDNSYVASQVFDAERTAQIALGWSLAAEAGPGGVVLQLTDAGGVPVEGASVAAEIGRPTTRTEDRTLAFVANGADWRDDAPVGPGAWEIRVQATAADGTAFRQVLERIVP